MEITPCLETLETRAPSSLGNAPGASIPIPCTGRVPRTYRVVRNSPANKGGGGSVIVTEERGDLEWGDSAAHGASNARSVPVNMVSTSLTASRGFMGSIWRSRGPTPEGSLHGDLHLLPHHYRMSPSEAGMLGSSPPPQAASVLHTRPSGTLRRPAHMAHAGGEGALRHAASANNLCGMHQAGQGHARPVHYNQTAYPGQPSQRVLPPAGVDTRAVPMPRSSSSTILLHYPGSGSWQYGTGIGPPPAAVTDDTGPAHNGARQCSGHIMPSHMPMSPIDLALLASSLPAGFGQPAAATMRRIDSALRLSNPSHDPNVHGSMGLVGDAEQAGSVGHPPLSQALPICLICLEMLTPADFASGEAMQLACLCKGEVAMRHWQCATEWSNVKGSLICDICKAPISNLPPLDPVIQAAREKARQQRSPAFSTADGLADYLFDGLRVMWITVICIILFVDVPITQTQTFGIGAAVGAVYSLISFSCSRACGAWRAASLRRQGAQSPGLGSSGTTASSNSLMTPLLLPG